MNQSCSGSHLQVRSRVERHAGHGRPLSGLARPARGMALPGLLVDLRASLEGQLASWPSCRSLGVTKRIELWRCPSLYQRTNLRAHARACREVRPVLSPSERPTRRRVVVGDSRTCFFQAGGGSLASREATPADPCRPIRWSAGARLGTCPTYPWPVADYPHWSPNGWGGTATASLVRVQGLARTSGTPGVQYRRTTPMTTPRISTSLV